MNALKHSKFQFLSGQRVFAENKHLLSNGFDLKTLKLVSVQTSHSPLFFVITQKKYIFIVMVLWPLCSAFFLNVILGLISTEGKEKPKRTLVKAKCLKDFFKIKLFSSGQRLNFVLYFTTRFSLWATWGLFRFFGRRQAEMSIMKHAKMRLLLCFLRRTHRTHNFHSLSHAPENGLLTTGS